ncbi:uncharacterized protein F4817DRAFT_143737 [Daldinia loculata]|uniref:uncharacterized protein n=1 Tax=Daldinia loculata TaxID=103429 RepID=UPI0020C2F84B|nr:uncharacterized protein F4817DRAFT_143737 [Daldinia loculata]KAI1646313.1 hypothetical protein F4817DRAFT_143737 [Daldinia loculata]
MDAQNAVESANTKQAASPKRGFAESEDPKSTVTANNATTNNIKPSLTAKTPSTSKELRPVPILPSAQDDDVGPDQNSDAETIVLPGKDGVSPSKPRKVIKHEDRSDGEIDDVLPPPRKYLKDGKNGDRNGGPSDDVAFLERKKRLPGKEKQPRSKEVSSGLSSAPASPPPHRRNNHEHIHRRRRSSDAHSESGSESSKTRPNKDTIKHKSKSVDRLLPGKRKAPKAESDDEGESRKVRRPRISDAGLDNQAVAREKDQKPSSVRLPHDRQSTSRNRSLSPHGRVHRRSLSTQLPSQSSNGFSTKKRRIPAPLQSTDYHSDDSSASGSPHPRSSKLRSIATPVTGESTISPARMPAHKKHVDNHGQTLLAKACAKGEYEAAKKRLTERPEDLNFADYAGNTPLQVASLNGHEQIVQLLIDAGCNLDCRNSDKETPLLDAVENGHLGVVKLLLKAGVNPRKADAEGHEPLEKVPDELENAEEIRAALREAKERVGELRRTSEDHPPHDMPDTLSSHGPESPRRSPAASGSSTLAAQRRGGAVRSTKTSNHLLYMNLDDKTLRQAAARGDNETVTRVLQVKERCDDPEALVNAARGGHSFVVELLLALGGANPDPLRPVPGLPAEHGTPMLAAIGGENIEVIKLLLNASNFDPTRRYKGQTYYEIARRREGPMWKEEEHLLKNAYDEFKKSPKVSSKTKSPGRRDRDRELDPESRRANRNESNLDAVRSHKRRPSSPSRDVDSKKKASRDRRELDKASPLEKTSITVASDDVDVDMRDAPQTHSVEESEAQIDRERKEAKRKQAEAEAIAAEEAKRKDIEQKRQEAEKKKQEAEARRREEVEKKRLQEEERIRLEKEEKRRKEEEERVRLEEERKEKEEQERKLREEEERKRKEEEERKRQEEEARIRREREAAEEAQRLREEEEQKEQERKRAERAAREAEMQRARQEEMEKIRLSKLPPLLRWLDACPNPKQKDIAELFAIARGVRYDTINPSATGHASGREQWLLNTQVALLLGEKDTSLSRYTAWERIPVSHIAKRVIWRLEQDRYALTEGKLYHLGEQLPNFYGGNPWSVGYRRLEQIRGEAWKCFSETEMFFVKQSDFLYIVPTIPHLRNVKLSIWYCELPEHESALSTWSTPAKWKQDPDAESRGGFAPQSKYYINGELVGEKKPQPYQPSKTPFPDHRVPRRGGLVAVTPDEPDYARICIEQGLTHLLTDQQKQAVLNGAHLTPRSMVSNEALDYVGENLSPSTELPSTRLVNGIKSAHESPDKLPVNGTSGDDSGSQRRGS